MRGGPGDGASEEFVDDLVGQHLLVVVRLSIELLLFLLRLGVASAGIRLGPSGRRRRFLFAFGDEREGLRRMFAR